VPFGGRRHANGGLVSEATEQAAITRIRASRDEGLTVRAIRDRVAEQGMRLSHVGVSHALKGFG